MSHIKGCRMPVHDPPHVAHQGVPHAGIEMSSMVLTFLFYGIWDTYLNSDRYQQQVRLAVPVARIRGTVWSGVCAC